jgi:hypothetical protein
VRAEIASRALLRSAARQRSHTAARSHHASDARQLLRAMPAQSEHVLTDHVCFVVFAITPPPHSPLLHYCCSLCRFIRPAAASIPSLLLLSSLSLLLCWCCVRPSACVRSILLPCAVAAAAFFSSRALSSPFP